MEILIIFVVMILAGTFLVVKTKEEELSITLCLFGGIGLLICLLGLPLNRYTIFAEIKEYEALIEVLENARQNETIENAALQLQVVKTNQWLANKKYYNETAFDIWIPDEIEKLEPIK